MAQAVVLPKVGMTMEEGKLVRWLVDDGAVVTKGQPVFEMETEKVEMEVEADDDGVLRRLVDEGTTMKPGDVVGCLLAPGEEMPADFARLATSAKAGTAAPQAVVSPHGASPTAFVRATPIARRLADENRVDLALVTGSGPEGRVTERDVQSYVQQRSEAPAAHPEALEPRPSPTSNPYAGRRQTIGERMLRSLQTMAQLTLTSETPVGEAQRMVHSLNREWRRDGVVVTLTALVVKAAALALRDHPRLNARLQDDRIDLLPEINVGFAVDLDEGLMAPVVQAADALSLKDLAGCIADLTERAKAGGLSLADVDGGTFTVTSLDSTRVDAFTPVVNPPQAAILGVGRVRDTLVLDEGQVVRQPVTTLSLTFDHRVVDGAPAARFLTRVCELLERPYLLM